MKNNKNTFSRKTFLKSTVFGGALLGLSPAIVLAEEKVKLVEEEKNLRILFQGDSITDGNRGRNEDPNHIMGHGYAFSVASRVGADFPAAGFSFFNRGISGNTVTDLEQRWQKDTLDLKPDVLSVLVGINDVGALIEHWSEPKSVEEFEAGYRKLLTLCKQQNPKILFILGMPFVFPVGSRKENWNLWKDETHARAEVVRKIAKDFDAVYIDFQTLFEKASKLASIEYWIWDGIHPTVFGHELMAREWIKQTATRLKFLRYYDY